MPTGSPRPRAARLHDHGKPLVVEEVDLPVPGEDEVLVEMAFAGVNPADRYVAEGRLAPDAPLPRTLGMEGAGRVAADGRPVLLQGGGLGAQRDGAWAERVLAPRAVLTDIPAGVDATCGLFVTRQRPPVGPGVAVLLLPCGLRGSAPRAGI